MTVLRSAWWCPGVVFGLVLLAVPMVGQAQRVSDVSNTKHNLSASGPGPVRAVSESQICVFCHTPHGADRTPGAPLWNRQLSGATYTPYTSSSIDADDIAATPGGSSKLCLSCHDGTLAIGNVNVANGQTDVTIAMTGTAGDGTMPPGSGTQTGFTRDLGVDLTNDHPISFTYDSALANADGELRDPALVDHIGNRVPGTRPSVPLEANKLECTACHDPHIRDLDPTVNAKFLRLNRFQVATPAGGQFNETADIVCLGCHDKLGVAWAQSSHADPVVAAEQYTTAASNLREFPPSIRVWEASCLNCHDTHTVQGARRLLREGTDSLASPKSGGLAAQEETCYQCHTTASQSILTSVTEVPNIESDFLLPRRMPITTADQQAGSEAHDPVDADLVESQTQLGKGNLINRHAECTDCHNPHRILRNELFNANGSNLSGTHRHDTGHTNIASGVLRGTWGVEPVYGSASFFALPSSYVVKRGDGGNGASTALNSPWVTREYQICLKCHSDYGYDDNNQYPVGNRPNLGDSGGGTPAGTNDLDQYTNQAREFQAPEAHKGGTTATGGGAANETNNHRSWHPVMDVTGRNKATRTMGGAQHWRDPWNNDVGAQTMYCTDCHGSNTAATTVVPSGTNPWGPHGSTNNFILKGPWASNNSTLCDRCHNPAVYRTGSNTFRDPNNSGFSGPSTGRQLHWEHVDKIGANLRCNWCHTMVPHGFKNKALLVNTNDVGPEAGLAPGTSRGVPFTQGPYYLNAMNRIVNFRESGTWRDTDCGVNNNNNGRDWMRNVCDNPP